MPTDLRAALREAAAALASEAANKRATIHSAVFGDALPSRYDAIAARLHALADAPPTVAELLTDDRFISGTHAIAFTCHDGAELWIRSGAWKAFTVEVNPRGRHSNATKKPNLYAYDFRQSARLVEVTP